MSKNFNVPPPETKYCILTFPSPRVLLITINRPKQLNALNLPAHFELDGVFNWYNKEPELWVAIVSKFFFFNIYINIIIMNLYLYLYIYILLLDYWSGKQSILCWTRFEK